MLDRVLRPDYAYVVWILTACAQACAGDLDAALRTVDRGVAATRGVPVVALPTLAARAHLLARLGCHAEAAEARRRDRTGGAAGLTAPARDRPPRRRLVALAAGRAARRPR